MSKLSNKRVVENTMRRCIRFNLTSMCPAILMGFIHVHYGVTHPLTNKQIYTALRNLERDGVVIQNPIFSKSVQMRIPYGFWKLT